MKTLSKGSFQGYYKGNYEGFRDIGALISRIGFWGVPYYIYSVIYPANGALHRPIWNFRVCLDFGAETYRAPETPNPELSSYTYLLTPSVKNGL